MMEQEQPRFEGTPSQPQVLDIERIEREIKAAETELIAELRLASLEELIEFQKQHLNDRELQQIVLEEINQRYDEADREVAELTAEEQGLPSQISRILGQTAISLERYGAIEPTRLTLIEQGFTPERAIFIDGREIWLSNVLQIEGGDKEICGAYFKTKNGYQLRTFVTSQSQGIWRYYPAYIVHPTDSNNDKIGWHVKGASEESLGLPWSLQCELAQQPRERATYPCAWITSDESSLMLMGSSAFRVPRKEYVADRATIQRAAVQQALLIGGTEQIGEQIQGFPSGIIGRLQEEPEQLDFVQPNQRPDFTNQLASWRANPAHYGPTTFEVYRSKDGQIDYIIGRTDSGKIWIAHAEIANEKTNSAGLKRRWVNAGVLTAPAIEYKGDQAGRFGGEPINTEYIDAFVKFHNRLPVIQDYLAIRPFK